MTDLDPGLWVFRTILLLFGACMGSFLAAAAYRIPREQSLMSASSCVHCGQRVSLVGLIPIIGILIVKARCPHCGHKVSYHYAVVETLVALLTLATVEVHVGTTELLALFIDSRSFEAGSPGAMQLAFSGPLIASLWLLYSGVLLSLIDLEFRILPDLITLPGIVIGLLISWLDPDKGILFGLMGAGFGLVVLWTVAALYERLRGREGMGFGDVKYLAMLGAVLGWSGVLWVLMIGSLAGSIVGLAIGIGRALFGKDTERGEGLLQVAIPFGPFLALGALIYSVFWKELSEFLFLGGG